MQRGFDVDKAHDEHNCRTRSRSKRSFISAAAALVERIIEPRRETTKRDRARTKNSEGNGIKRRSKVVHLYIHSLCGSHGSRAPSRRCGARCDARRRPNVEARGGDGARDASSSRARSGQLNDNCEKQTPIQPIAYFFFSRSSSRVGATQRRLCTQQLKTATFSPFTAFHSAKLVGGGRRRKALRGASFRPELK